MSYVYSTTNTLDTIEAFIAETYVQLVATESMCYSTSCSALTDGLTPNRVALYCVVLYIVSCVDVSGTLLSGTHRTTTFAEIYFHSAAFIFQTMLNFFYSIFGLQGK